MHQHKNANILQAFESLVPCTYTCELASLALNVSSHLDSKDTVSISNKRNFKSLKHCWLFQPVSNKATVSGGDDKVGQSIERGSLITLKLSRRSGASGMTGIRKKKIVS